MITKAEKQVQELPNQKLINKLNEALGTLNKMEYRDVHLVNYPPKWKVEIALKHIREVREALS